MTIGIVGFGRFGQFIGKILSKTHEVVAINRSDQSAAADEMGKWSSVRTSPEPVQSHKVSSPTLELLLAAGRAGCLAMWEKQLVVAGLISHV